MRRTAFKFMAAATALAFTTSCATIMYPERKGNNSSPVETLPLVLDILLFLPGVIPGVVALVIDFGNGSIYTQKKGNAKPFLTEGDAPSSAPQASNRASTAEGEDALELQVRVYGADATVLDSRSVMLTPALLASHHADPMSVILGDLDVGSWQIPAARVELVTPGGAPLWLTLDSSGEVAAL